MRLVLCSMISAIILGALVAPALSADEEGPWPAPVAGWTEPGLSVDGDKVRAGRQVVSFDGHKLVLAE